MRKHVVIGITLFASFILVAGCNADSDRSSNGNGNTHMPQYNQTITSPPESSVAIPEVPVAQLRLEFETRLYQDADEATSKVDKFNSKAAWIEYMSEIADLALAQAYADEFFLEKDGGLYIVPRDGPAMLLLDQPYELKNIGEHQAQVTQTAEDIMYGKYKLTITYEYRDGHWIIQDRDFISL